MDHHTNDYRITIQQYDLLNRVTQERIEDAQGVILHITEYGYDSDGNKILDVICTQSAKAFVRTEYNSRKQPIKIVDPEGNETRFSYNYQARNAYGQQVLAITQTDALGNQIITGLNTLGKEENVIEERSIWPDRCQKGSVLRWNWRTASLI